MNKLGQIRQKNKKKRQRKIEELRKRIAAAKQPGMPEEVEIRSN